jgi:hypothetical protein
MNKEDVVVLRYGGLKPEDAPKFVDAFILDAEYKDGTPLSASEISELNEDYEFIFSRLYN